MLNRHILVTITACATDNGVPDTHKVSGGKGDDQSSSIEPAIAAQLEQLTKASLGDSVRFKVSKVDSLCGGIDPAYVVDVELRHYQRVDSPALFEETWEVAKTFGIEEPELAAGGSMTMMDAEICAE